MNENNEKNTKAPVKGDLKSPTKEYKIKAIKIKTILIIGIIIVFILGYLSLMLGVSNVSFTQMLDILINKPNSNLTIVIWNLRLPRIIADIVAGAGLGICGCVMQSNLKNHLAAPSTIGVTNAAAFGANLAIIVFGAGTFTSGQSGAIKIAAPYLVTIFAFAFAILSVILVMLLSKINSFSADIIILAGVAISSLFAAGTTFVQYFGNDQNIAQAVFWTFGNPGRVSWNELFILLVVFAISISYFMFKSWDYNAMLNGEGIARRQSKIIADHLVLIRKAEPKKEQGR